MNNTYYNELKKLKILDNERIKEIYTRVENGDSSQINEIITGNLKFVVSIAKKYYENLANKTVIELDDLISEGNYGLIEACHKFKIEFGVRFSTYAVYWIKKQILNSINQNESTIRIPANRLQANRRIRKAINQLYQQHQYQPSQRELEELELFTDKELDDYFNQQQKIIAVEDQYNIEDVIENTDEADYQFELKRKIKIALKYLTPKERIYIRMKFGIDQSPASHQEINKALNVTKQRASQLRTSALAKLKDMLGNAAI